MTINPGTMRDYDTTISDNGSAEGSMKERGGGGGGGRVLARSWSTQGARNHLSRVSMHGWSISACLPCFCVCGAWDRALSIVRLFYCSRVMVGCRHFESRAPSSPARLSRLERITRVSCVDCEANLKLNELILSNTRM